jgi:predicted enzyme related to lactoylglutathione lyase
MSMVAAPEPGTLCAALLHTRDLDAAARHYQAVFGWDARPDAGGTTFTLGGRRVAAAVVAAGVHGWVPYAAVQDVDAVAALAVRNGGSLVEAPAGSTPDGRRRLVMDPDGAVLGLCPPDDAAALELMDEPGSVWWMEVLANAPDVARTFYGTVLQWQFTARPLPPHPSYLVGRCGDTQAGGILPIGSGWNTPPRWQLLFRVDDLECSTAQVEAAGGSIEFGPLDVPTAGILTSVRDPHGALYVLTQPHPRSAA